MASSGPGGTAREGHPSRTYHRRQPLPGWRSWKPGLQWPQSRPVTWGRQAHWPGRWVEGLCSLAEPSGVAAAGWGMGIGEGEGVRAPRRPPIPPPRGVPEAEKVGSPGR